MQEGTSVLSASCYTNMSRGREREREITRGGCVPMPEPVTGKGGQMTGLDESAFTL